MNRLVYVLAFPSILMGCTAGFPIDLIPDGAPPTDSAIEPDASTTDALVPSDGAADSEVPPGCGDGVISGTEACDDANTDNGDGCSSTCQVEDGWYCTGQPSQCDTQCGDGIVAGTEQCDDGNQVNGDGCNGECVVDCSNESTSDCNYAGETLNVAAAFVDPSPPAGFVQCAGFRNTPANDVGPHWEAHCLGQALTLRIRYWDTTDNNNWVLLGDATLSPESEAAYTTQTFSATNHGGTDGFRETDGVVFLKDNKDALPLVPPTKFTCTAGPPARHYEATDLYFFSNHANNNDVRLILVSGWSNGEDGTALQSDAAELSSILRSSATCVNALLNERTTLAIALYYAL